MKAAVTGASGHIGSCLVRELKKQGYGVKALAHTSENGLENSGAELIQGSLLDRDSLKSLCRDVQVVFHLAARITIDNRNSERSKQVNITGTEHILLAAQEAGVKKFIHFSSIHAHKIHPVDEILDEKRPLVDSENTLYEYTKAESEKVVQRYVNKGMNAVILNPTAVIGPYDFNRSFLGQALRKMYTNRLPMLVPGGYNWVDVRDVVAAAICAVDKGRKGEKYILSGHYYTLKNLSLLIGEVSGKKTPTKVLPASVARIACPFIQMYARLAHNDPLYTIQSLDIIGNCPERISFEKAQNELNYSLRPLERTLIDTINWYKENGFLKE
jgi:dihydroflavonol-4-reductase